MLITSSFIVAASSLFSQAFGAPIPASSLAQRAVVYQKFGGNGKPDFGWPREKEWKNTFDNLWKANLPVLKISCAQFNVPNNSDDEISAIKAAIQAGTQATGIPSEVILAMVIQESKGCVRAPTTNYGHDNPGLMQSFEGTASCNKGGVVTTPCPADNIKSQILEGLGQLGRPFGLQQALEKAAAGGNGGVERFYRAARVYNSNNIVDDNLGAGIATHCYASDIANRLLGWTTEASSCEEATIASFKGSSARAEQGNTETEGNGNTNNNTPPPQNNGNSEPTVPKGPGAASTCKTWYTVKLDDTCASSGHEAALRKFNQIDANCGNLWFGYAYCIAQ